MKGLEIPRSFREECKCCKGTGGHQVCTPLERACELCEGTGHVMNALGQDLMKMLAYDFEATVAKRMAAYQEGLGGA